MLAKRKGVTIRKGGPDDFPALYSMYAQTALRDGFVIRDEAYYFMFGIFSMKLEWPFRLLQKWMENQFQPSSYLCLLKRHITFMECPPVNIGIKCQIIYCNGRRSSLQSHKAAWFMIFGEHLTNLMKRIPCGESFASKKDLMERYYPELEHGTLY